jgi:hypothetical protein
MELTAGTFRAELHDVVADDRHTVAMHLAMGQREGRTLEDREVLVFHVSDGRLVEVCGSTSRTSTPTMSSSPRGG